MNRVAATLEVRLLGQADVIAANRSVKFAKRSIALAMIAYLAMRRGQAVARDFLAYTLFPDHDEETALADLRRALYLTSKALPAGDEGPWLIADNETVRWNGAAAGATIDALEFERLAGDPQTRAAALDLYRGDLLEDLYDDWIVAERERLRTLYLQTLETVLAYHRDRREYTHALGYAHRLLAADTWREDVVRQAMAIRYISGDTPGALAEFDSFAKRLRDEMTIGPMPETLALRQTIARNEPLVGSARPTVDRDRPGPVARAAILPFVGRDDERARLQHAWDRAARGFGNVAIVSGEAGIGKTRLVGELAQIVEREGGRAYCGGTAFPESPAYQCLVEALRSALPVVNAHPLPPLTLAILAGVVPEFAETAPAVDIQALAPDREVARLLDAFARAFVHLAASRPLLLVFEDLHWAADPTIDAITMLARRIAKARVLVIGTYRDEETPASHPARRLVATLGGEGHVTRMQINRLARSDVRQMLAKIEGFARGDAVADRLYARSEGNPLFLNEALADELDGERTDDAFVPSGIRSVIAARMERLSDGARTIAQIAAVCGHGCNVDVVRDVAGFTLAETLAGFNELLDRRLLREAGSRERYDFVFSHHLIGASIYDGIPAPVRVRRHARAAHVIEHHPVRAARELARHFDLAGMPVQTTRWCIEAAREATAVHAGDDAVRYATLALRHSPGNIEALLLREEASARLGRREAQLADLDTLDGLAVEPDVRFMLLRRRVALARACDERDAERTAVDALRAAAGASGTPHWAGVAACANAHSLVASAQYGPAKAAAREALDAFGDDGPAHDRIDALCAYTQACAARGEFAEATAELARAQTLAASAGDAATVLEMHLQAAAMFMTQQRFGDVFSHAATAADGFRALGDRVGEARALVSVATSGVRLSRWEEARCANRAAADIFEAIGDRAGLARVRMNLGMLHGRCGDLRVARELVASARELHIALGDERARTASLINEGFLAIWEGDPVAAKHLADEALTRARAIGHAAYWATALGNLGAALRDLGQTDAAIASMEDGLSRQLELGRLSDAVSDLADLALAYARRGDLTAARRLAEQILTVETAWTDSAVFPPYPPWVAACVFHWTGDARAATALEAADATARAYAHSIDVPDLRSRFEALPFIAGIASAMTRDDWPARDAALARRQDVDGTHRA